MPKPHSKTRHGLSKNKVYLAWRDMFTRCTNRDHPYFDDYGGRGIKVCLRWHCFEFFLVDVGMPPTAKHQLERRNNNKNYELGNARWATAKEQARNRRNSVRITWQRETHTLPEWAEILGVPYHALRERWYRGWKTERIFTQPFRSP